MINPEAAVIVAGDFNQMELTAVLPKFQKFIHHQRQSYIGPGILQHIRSIQGCSCSSPGSVCGADSNMQTSDLQDDSSGMEYGSYFSTTELFRTDWELCKDGSDLEAYTSSALRYVQFCTDAVLPTKSIKVFPNQKPWCDRTVQPLLKAQDAAFRSRKRLAYGRAWTELMKDIQHAKLRYRSTLTKTPGICGVASEP